MIIPSSRTLSSGTESARRPIEAKASGEEDLRLQPGVHVYICAGKRQGTYGVVRVHSFLEVGEVGCTIFSFICLSAGAIKR